MPEVLVYILLAEANAVHLVAPESLATFATSNLEFVVVAFLAECIAAGTDVEFLEVVAGIAVRHGDTSFYNENHVIFIS